MRYSSLLALGAALVAVAACKNDKGVYDPAPIPPMAHVRFINAVVDTGIVDFRFIDKVENLPNFLGVRFRGSSGVYSGVTPGTRPVRIFPNTTIDSLAKKRLIDTTITLDANERYTLLYVGQARGNADRLIVIHEAPTLPTPPAGKIDVRVLNADPVLGTLDLYAARSDTADSSVMTKAAAKIAGVGLYTLSPYTEMATTTAPVSATVRAADSVYKFAATPTGGTTATYTLTSNAPGAQPPTGSTYGPTPGYQIAGSVLTLLLTPPPTPGSPAATSAGQASSSRVVVIPDKPLNP